MPSNFLNLWLGQLRPLPEPRTLCPWRTRLNAVAGCPWGCRWWAYSFCLHGPDVEARLFSIPSYNLATRALIWVISLVPWMLTGNLLNKPMGCIDRPGMAFCRSIERWVRILVQGTPPSCLSLWAPVTPRTFFSILLSRDGMIFGYLERWRLGNFSLLILQGHRVAIEHWLIHPTSWFLTRILHSLNRGHMGWWKWWFLAIRGCLAPFCHWESIGPSYETLLHRFVHWVCWLTGLRSFSRVLTSQSSWLTVGMVSMLGSSWPFGVSPLLPYFPFDNSGPPCCMLTMRWLAWWTASMWCLCLVARLWSSPTPSLRSAMLDVGLTGCHWLCNLQHCSFTYSVPTAEGPWFYSRGNACLSHGPYPLRPHSSCDSPAVSLSHCSENFLPSHWSGFLSGKGEPLWAYPSTWPCQYVCWWWWWALCLFQEWDAYERVPSSDEPCGFCVLLQRTQLHLDWGWSCCDFWHWVCGGHDPSSFRTSEWFARQLPSW